MPSLFPFLLVSPSCLTSSGQVSLVGSSSKRHCFWKVPLIDGHQAASHNTCCASTVRHQLSAKSPAHTAWQLLNPWPEWLARPESLETHLYPALVSVSQWELCLKWGIQLSCREAHKTQESKIGSTSWVSKQRGSPVWLCTSHFSSPLSFIRILGYLYNIYNWCLNFSLNLLNNAWDRCLYAFIFHVSLCSDPNNTLHL